MNGRGSATIFPTTLTAVFCAMIFFAAIPARAVDIVDLRIWPRTQIAPVGSEVILVGGVVASDNHYETDARIDWVIQEGSVGEFIDVQDKNWTAFWVGNRINPERVAPNYARSSTLRSGIVLDRGTPQTTDDVKVEAGQAWASVTSAVEGTTYVSANAPAVKVWPRRRQDLQIHWVDCQWSYPAPRRVAAGTTEMLTTSLKRANGTPCEGWLVEYKIMSGPSASFQPGGETVTTLRTDVNGNASVQIAQNAAAPGISTIQVTVTRPEIPGSRLSSRLVIGSAPTTIRWASSALNVQRVGTLSVTTNNEFRYSIRVANSGDLEAKKVVVKETFPDGMKFTGSRPGATMNGQVFQWTFDSLAPGAVQTIEVGAMATRAGTFQTSSEVQSADGGNISKTIHTLTASDNVGLPPPPASGVGTGGGEAPGGTAPGPAVIPTTGNSDLAVQVQAPTSVKVGERYKVTMRISNTGTVAVDRMVVSLTFSNNLTRSVTLPTSSNLIYNNKLPPIPAGQAQPLELEFEAIAAGTAVHQLDVSWGEIDTRETSTKATTQITQ